jgi:hypothetical protein
MVALCEQAGFKGRAPPVRASASSSPGPGTGSSPGTLTKLGYGAATLGSLAGVYTTVGAALYYGPENKPTYTVMQTSTADNDNPYTEIKPPRDQKFLEFLKNGLQRNKTEVRDPEIYTSW